MSDARRPDRPSIAALAAALRDDAQAAAIELLSMAGRAPNKAASSRDELRFGRHGSLSIKIAGPKRGVVFDHSGEYRGGDLYALAEQILGRDAARNWATAFVGGAAGDFAAPSREDHDRRREAEAEAEEADRQDRIERAREIWRATVPIAGTLGEQYLAGRAITAAMPPDVVRWLPATGYRTFGGVVFAATNAEGDVEAVQVVSVGPDGRKAPGPAPKKSRGWLRGHAVVRLPGAEPVVLAEGPETGLSVWQASGRKTWVTLGLSNIRAAPLPDGAAGVVARDHDPEGGAAHAKMGEAINELRGRGHRVAVAMPPAYPDLAKSDWNDALQREGDAFVRAEIAAAVARLDGPDPDAPQPHWPGPTEGRDAALASQRHAIGGFFAGFERGWLFEREAEARSAKAHAAAGLDDGQFDASVQAEVSRRIEAMPVGVADALTTDELLDLERKARRWAHGRKAALTKRARAELLAEKGLDEAPEREPPLLVTGAQGSGKTRAAVEDMVKLPAGVVAWYAAPTLQKAEEFAADYGHARRPDSLPIMVVRGRGAPLPFGAGGEEGDTMCRRSKIADRVARAGLPVAETLCYRPTTGRACRFLDNCEYVKQRQSIREAAGSTGVVLALTHDHLFLPGGLPAPDLVVVDESAIDKAVGVVEFAPAAIEKCADHRWRTGPGAIGTQMDSLAEYRATARIITAAITEHRGREMAFLREQGVDKDRLKAAIKYLDNLEQRLVAGLEPDTDDAEALRLLERVDEAEVARILTLLRQVEREMRHGRDGFNGIVYRPDALVTVGDQQERQPRVTVSFVKVARPAGGKPVLALDGTGAPELNRALWGDDMRHVRIAVERDAVVEQVEDKLFSRRSLLGAHSAKAVEGADDRFLTEARRLREQIGELVGMQPGPVFVATNKQVLPFLEPHFAGSGERAVKVGHFGALRGINAFEHCETAVVIGREEPPIAEIEEKARAFAAQRPEPFRSAISADKPAGEFLEEKRGRRLRSGGVSFVTVRTLPDDLSRAVLEQIREAEVVQAIDRVRPIFNRRRILILSGTCLDVTVDRVRPWREMREGGSRIERAFARTGRSVLLKSAGELSRCFPDLWSSENAAKMDRKQAAERGVSFQLEYILEKDPPFRVVRYRRAGQRGSPCEAWITPGLLDPREALEMVTGPVAAFEIVEPANAAPVTLPDTPGVIREISQEKEDRTMSIPNALARTRDAEPASEAPRAPVSAMLPRIPAGDTWRGGSRHDSFRIGPPAVSQRVTITRAGRVIDGPGKRSTIVVQPIEARRAAEADAWTWRDGAAFDASGGETGRIGCAGVFVPRASYGMDDAWWPLRAAAVEWAAVRPGQGRA